MYVSMLLGSSHKGMGRVSGVTPDCSFSKCVCSVSTMVWGCEVICSMSGSVMVVRFGWCLAHDCRPTVVSNCGGIVWVSFCIMNLPFFS